MVLDSSGTCDGERRMAVGYALGDSIAEREERAGGLRNGPKP